MLGKRRQRQGELFGPVCLGDLVPEDHILRRIDRVLDLSWLRGEVRDCYCGDNGRASEDPEALVRLMIAGLVEGITKDRALERRSQVDVAFRWFAGFGLYDRVPDHSTYSVARKRWGAERFKRIFVRSVMQCVAAGLVKSELVHIDATLIRADVSWESLVVRHVEQVLQENATGPEEPPDSPGSKPRRGKPKKAKKVSRTDPDASLSTSCKQQRMEPCFKQHTAVDGESGVVVDVEVTTGEASEGKQLLEQIERVEQNTGQEVQAVTADGGYAHGDNYKALLERDIEESIPPQKTRTSRTIPASRFKYDALHERVVCPAGKVLTAGAETDRGRWYRAHRRDCDRCRLRARCLAKKVKRRSVLIVNGYIGLVRARRAHWRGDPERRRRYRQHRWRVEGVHGEAKQQHGLRRAARRGLDNVAIQVYLTALVINLKRLAAALGGSYRAALAQWLATRLTWPRDARKRPETPNPSRVRALAA
jgi:transposase